MGVDHDVANAKKSPNAIDCAEFCEGHRFDLRFFRSFPADLQNSKSPATQGAAHGRKRVPRTVKFRCLERQRSMALSH
jgi:hypothetical protein